MKLLVFSDSHLGASRYNLSWFRHELQLVFDEVFQKANDLEVDGILFCGDLFDSPLASNNDMVFAIRVIRSYNKPVILIVGNHDLQSSRPLDESPIQIINESCDNVNVLHKDVDISVVYNDVNLIGISYLSPLDFQEHTSHTSMLQQYYDRIDPNKINIALFHQDLSGLNYSKYIPYTINTDDLEPFDFSLFGHYHNRIESDNYLFVGSTYPLSFKQAEQQKGCYLLTVNDKEVTYKFVPLTNHKHKLKEIIVDNLDENVCEMIEYLIDNAYDVIRLVFQINEVDLPQATLLAKDLRKKYHKKLEKFMVDFNIIDRSIEEQEHHDVEFKDMQQYTLAFANLLTKRYEYDKDFVIKALDILYNTEFSYKSESKQIEQAFKNLYPLIKEI